MENYIISAIQLNFGKSTKAMFVTLFGDLLFSDLNNEMLTYKISFNDNK